MTPDGLSAERAAQNQSLFRAVNEEIRALAGRLGAELAPAGFVCECADLGCRTRISLAADEYEQLRRTPTRFAVMPEGTHVFTEFERLVQTHERYWIVEKAGAAAAVAVALDRR